LTQERIEVKVFRYNPSVDSKPRFDTFTVPYTQDMTVLDALHYIYENLDPTLAYRWSCRAGQCGSCAMIVNGKPCAACRMQVERGKPLSIAPLTQFPVVRDLVVDTTRAVDRIMKIRPFVERTRKPQRPEIIAQKDIDPVKEFRKCLECWACISACPAVAEAWYEFAGPAMMGKLARLEFDGRDQEDRARIAFLEGLYDCTTCRICAEVCPKSIDIPSKAIEKLRALVVKSGVGPLDGHMIPIDLIKKIGRSVDKLSQPLLEKLPDTVNPDGETDEVGFFTGCLIDYRLQETGLDIIETLERNRVKVHIPKDQVCCGSPLFRIGAVDVAEQLVVKNVQAFERLGVKKVVVGCAGCGLTLKLNFPEVAKRVLGREPSFKVHDLTEYLVHSLGLKNLNVKDMKPLQMRITWHQPCHLGRGQGVVKEPLEVLAKIPGVQLAEMREPDRCCGSGGGVRSGRRPLAMAIGRRKTELIMETGAEACVTECPFCQIHIQDSLNQVGAPTKVYSVPNLLAEAYRGGARG